MNKKKIISLSTAVLLLIPGTAFAKGNDKDKTVERPAIETKDKSHKTEGKNEVVKNKAEEKKDTTQEKNKALEKKEAARQNKEAAKDFKEDLRAKHEIMKANTKESIALKQDIEKKREQLAAIIEQLKEGKLTLAPDLLEQLTQKAGELKEIGEQVKALKDLNGDVEETQTEIKGNKFEAALLSLDKVIAKQNARLEALKALDASLSEILAIAVQAQPVVDQPGDSTTTQPTDTNTTTQSTDTTQSAGNASDTSTETAQAETDNTSVETNQTDTAQTDSAQTSTVDAPTVDTQTTANN